MHHMQAEADSEEGRLLSSSPDTSLKALNVVIQAKEAGISKPWWCYPLLGAAILAVSSAAATFSSMSEVSPFLLAAWRLQVTALCLLPAGCYQLFTLAPAERTRLIHQAPLLLASGVLLGGHFGTWVLCIQHTSLTHALLVGTTPPIFIALSTCFLGKPISRGELIGIAVAMIGGIFIAQSANSETEVTLFGDGIGLLTAAAFCVYLAIGSSFRAWLGLFSYVLPVNGFAALTLCIAAISSEGASFDRGRNGLFGWLGSWHYGWRVVYLGVCPGILGHVSFNALLKYLNPLLIALPCTIEPLLGSMMGLALGISSPPGIFTYIGGGVLLVATAGVVFASHKREQATLAAETLQKGAADDGTGEVELVVETLPVEQDTNVMAQEGSPLLRSQGPIIK